MHTLITLCFAVITCQLECEKRSTSQACSCGTDCLSKYFHWKHWIGVCWKCSGSSKTYNMNTIRVEWHLYSDVVSLLFRNPCSLKGSVVIRQTFHLPSVPYTSICQPRSSFYIECNIFSCWINQVTNIGSGSDGTWF